MKYNCVMIDLETTGVDPSHNAMIQLAAVRFNLDSRDIDPVMFDQCLFMPKNRFWHEDTREWWSKQDQSIIEKIWQNMRDPRQVLSEFVHWVQRDLDGTTPMLFAKPISFEWPFLQSYLAEYGVASPFHYSDCKDLRSITWALGFQNLDRELEFSGRAHDAIHDVLFQIQVLFEALDRADKKADHATP